MRLPILLLALTATACAPAMGASDNGNTAVNSEIDVADYDNDIAFNEADNGSAEETRVTDPATDTMALAMNVPKVEMTELWTISVDSCDSASWIAPPLVPDRKRRFACSMARIAYVARRPGYTDTVVTFPAERGHKTLDLTGVWDDPHTLKVLGATFEGGETIRITGSCTGSFDRPPDSDFAGDTHLESRGDSSASPLSCTLNDLQGKPIGAITFGSR